MYKHGDTIPDGYKLVCVKSYRHKSGKLIVAANYGKQAFCFLVPNDK